MKLLQKFPYFRYSVTVFVICFVTVLLLQLLWLRIVHPWIITYGVIPVRQDQVLLQQVGLFFPDDMQSFSDYDKEVFTTSIEQRLPEVLENFVDHEHARRVSQWRWYVAVWLRYGIYAREIFLDHHRVLEQVDQVHHAREQLHAFRALVPLTYYSVGSDFVGNSSDTTTALRKSVKNITALVEHYQLSDESADACIQRMEMVIRSVAFDTRQREEIDHVCTPLRQEAWKVYSTHFLQIFEQVKKDTVGLSAEIQDY